MPLTRNEQKDLDKKLARYAELKAAIENGDEMFIPLLRNEKIHDEWLARFIRVRGDIQQDMYKLCDEIKQLRAKQQTPPPTMPYSPT